MSTTSVSKVLKSLPVAHNAEESLREAAASGNAQALQKAWITGLSRPLKRIRKRLRRTPLLAAWSVDSLDLSARERELAAALQALQEPSGKKKKKSAAGQSKKSRSTSDVLADWVAKVRGGPGAWESLVIAEILLRDGAELSAEVFTASLVALSRGLLSKSGESPFPLKDRSRDTDLPDPVRMLISAGEAPLICGLLLSPLEGADELQQLGRQTLRRMLHESTDAEGCLHGSLHGRIPAVMASLARSTFWSDVFHQPLWEGEDLSRIQSMHSKACMLATPPQGACDGREVPEVAELPLQPVLELMLESLDSEHASKLSRLLRKTQKPLKEISVPKPFRAPKDSAQDETSEDVASSAEAKTSASDSSKALLTSWQSDTVCSAVLRSSLQPDADVIVLDWHAGQVQLQIFAGGVLVFSGPWHWSVQLNDKAITAPTAWKCSCWFDDSECVFIELEAENTDSLKCIRQIMLATRERFAILTDSVTTSAAETRVQLTTALPFVQGTTVTADAITREQVLTCGIARLRALPAWLEDDRVQHALGRFVEHDGQLELAGPGAGGVTLPLALDWHPNRAEAAADWARLTVTEARRYNGQHEAAGFRVRVGDFQVLLYRSLIPGTSSRACLGLNTWDETVYTRIPGRKTPMEGLVEVESPK